MSSTDVHIFPAGEAGSVSECGCPDGKQIPQHLLDLP